MVIHVPTKAFGGKEHSLQYHFKELLHSMCFRWLYNARHQLKGVGISLKPELIYTGSGYIGDGQGYTVEFCHSLCHAVGLKEYRQRTRGARRYRLLQIHKDSASVVGIYKSMVSEREYHVSRIYLHIGRAYRCRPSSIDP